MVDSPERFSSCETDGLKCRVLGATHDPVSYDERVRNEQAHYSSLLAAQPPGTEPKRPQPRVSVFEFAMQRYSAYIRSKMPHATLESHVVDFTDRSAEPTRMLSLGAGAGDWELAVARRTSPPMEITLVDLNEELMRSARVAAETRGITLSTVVADVNSIRITPHHYDLIVCRSSLHHFVELEHVLTQIRKGLSSRGEFLVIGEVIGRNGLMLYPETEAVAQGIFSSLPPRLRFNHYTKQVDEVVPNFDHSKGSFEAIRSEDILPLLMERFTPVEHVTFDAFLSLLLDWRYGPNYDLDLEMDRAVAALITEMDIQMVTNGVLRPTCLFGIFK